MRASTRKIIVVVGCLALPLGLLRSSERAGEAQDKTAQKKMTAQDKLAAKIQKAVSHDESLQPSSRDIEVTDQNDVITLKGTVQSDVDSQVIRGKAESLAIQEMPEDRINSGEFKIANELVVTPQR